MRLTRPVGVVAGVVLLHAAGLWALQTGLLRRAMETLVPVELVSDAAIPDRPTPTPPPALAPPAPAVRTRQAVADSKPIAPAPVAPVAQAPAPVATPAPAPEPAPLATHAPAATTQTVEAAAPVRAAGPAPRVELPSSDADYLQNPPPVYPSMSKRLGEQGRVIVRVLIGVDGTAQQAEVRQSSGFERLDQAALATARRWRYVPGKRGGVAEAMWFNVPIQFVLE